jgi:hypothetical protein
MFVEPIYKGFRIQVEAVEVEGRWDALVNIHRVFSDEKPHLDRVTCRKMTAERAEHLAAVPGEVLDRRSRTGEPAVLTAKFSTRRVGKTHP